MYVLSLRVETDDQDTAVKLADQLFGSVDGAEITVQEYIPYDPESSVVIAPEDQPKAYKPESKLEEVAPAEPDLGDGG